MNTGLAHTAARVVSCDRLPQTLLFQLCPALGAKEIVGVLALPKAQILAQNSDHRRAKRDHLCFLVFGVAIVHNTVVKVEITYLYGADGRGATTAIQQKIDNHPIPIFCKGRFADIGFFYISFTKLNCLDIPQH